MLESQLQSSGYHALGYSRRTQKKDAFARYGRQYGQGDGVFLLVNALAELFQKVCYAGVSIFHHRRKNTKKKCTFVRKIKEKPS
jgi:hypothetical protein